MVLLLLLLLLFPLIQFGSVMRRHEMTSLKTSLTRQFIRNARSDELALLFCEKVVMWGGTLNFSTTEFAKGPWILNMVITFVLIPRSQYNTIIKPRAHFLLSLMEGLSIDFPSHMIESIIDCY